MSVESVWELALTHLGHTGETVSDYTAPETAAQLILARVYPIALELCLGYHDWSFARARAQLTDITATEPPSGEWVYTWQLPTDLVTIRGFTIEKPNNGLPPLRREVARSTDGSEARVLYTTIDPFQGDEYMRYTKRVSTASEWTIPFEGALSAFIAIQAAIPLARDGNFQQTMLDYANRVILMSGEIDQKQQQPRRAPSSIEAARY